MLQKIEHLLCSISGLGSECELKIVTGQQHYSRISFYKKYTSVCLILCVFTQAIVDTCVIEYFI